MLTVLEVCLWSRHVRVALPHVPEAAAPSSGRPAFPGRQATARQDVEVFGAQLRRGLFSGSGACSRLRPGWRGDERVCSSKVSDPHLPLVRMGEVERSDPHVDEVVLGALPGVEERLELPHADVGSTMRQEGHSEAPVRLDALAVFLEGVYQGVRGRAVIDVASPLQLLQVKELSRLWRSPGQGGAWSPCLRPQGCQAREPPPPRTPTWSLV